MKFKTEIPAGDCPKMDSPVSMKEDFNRKKSKAALVSVLSNSSLVLLKVIVGFAIGSVSVISEAIHSAVDLLAAVIAFVAVRTSGKPADKEHPFGHGKVENISGAVEAFLIFIAAGWILYESVIKLRHPVAVGTPSWGVAVMFVSVVTNIAVSRMLFKVGKETESVALQADAWHLRTDVWTSLGVMGSLAVIWIGGLVFPGGNLFWLDPVAAMAVAFLIIGAAFKLTVESIGDLMDTTLPPDEEEQMRKLILDRQDVVKGYHKFRTRKAGNTRFVEFHIKVDPHMTVEASHEVGSEISGAIKSQFRNASVTIHIEPCDGRCTEQCLSGCLDKGDVLK